MTDRPIIFSGPEVRALLDGRKSQTRRVLKPQPGPFDALFSEDGKWWDGDAETGEVHCFWNVPYAVGDRLWVRETWNVPDAYLASERRETALGLMNYAATPWAIPGRWRPSIHMPRWASRLTLVVTDVRVQRLQEISEADALAEGVRGNAGGEWGREGLIEDFADLWNSLHGDDAWDQNPWVAALTFDVHRRNIDQMEPAP